MFRLKTYIFEHPTENVVRTIDRRSYIFAAVFGSFYVLYRGFVARFFMALLLDALLTLGALAVIVAVAVHLRGVEASLVLVFIPLVVIVVRAKPIVDLIKVGYIERGWVAMAT
ncbi:MAG TPA: hypothetical protein VMI56_13495 [Reyranella sp.]|nr:hypothetical protein [Reyranella sp.]